MIKIEIEKSKKLERSPSLRTVYDKYAGIEIKPDQSTDELGDRTITVKQPKVFRLKHQQQTSKARASHHLLQKSETRGHLQHVNLRSRQSGLGTLKSLQHKLTSKQKKQKKHQNLYFPQPAVSRLQPVSKRYQQNPNLMNEDLNFSTAYDLLKDAEEDTLNQFLEEKETRRRELLTDGQ